MAPFFVPDGEPTLKVTFICGSDSLADNRAVNVLRPSVHNSDKSRSESSLRARLGPALIALLLTGIALPGARASETRDHERARAAVEAGQILPLPTLLDRLRRSHPGQVLELELERDDGRWIYEVKLLQADGQLLKLEVDAATGLLLRVKRKAERNPDRKVESSKELPR